MNLNSIGSMNVQLQTMQMKSMWEMRQREKESFNEDMSKLKEASAENTSEESGTQEDIRLTGIQQKLNAGSKLTSDEKEYLRTKDPIAYQKVVKIEQEQKLYEQELRCCRTQEEVDRLKLTRLGESLATVNEVKNDPNIAKEDKLELIMQEKRRTDAINESTNKFIESGEYEDLPTEAEKALAEQKEAERAKQRIEEAKKAEKQPSSKQEEDLSVSDKAADAPKPDSVLSESEQHTESAEEKKVRQARAKAAYTAVALSAFEPKTQHAVNEKA